jgi:dTDP-4-amino-4,6-dideoxygalactose transaminase
VSEILAIDGGEPVRKEPLDPSRGAGAIGEEEIEAANEVLRSRSLFRYYGPNLLNRTAAFEEALKTYLQVEYALAVSSGTGALQCALTALGIEEGDEVIVPAVTFIATAGAVVHARAVPVFAEVDDSLNLNPASFEANITEKTRAVIPVHLVNVACDMEPILTVAARHGIRVLEDAAQAMGVTYHGKQVGTLGDAGVFSLQQEKNITSGEGGALVTRTFEVYDRAARYQDQGGQFSTSKGETREHTPGQPFLGVNLRMSELAGAIAGVQLQRLHEIVARSRAAAREIRRRLGDLPVEWRRLPDESGEGGSVVMFLRNGGIARRFGRALRAEGIASGQLYGGRVVYANPAIIERRTPWATGCPFNCKLHPSDRRYFPGLCPTSEELLDRSLAIAVGPAYSDRDVDDVVTAVRKVGAAFLG